MGEGCGGGGTLAGVCAHDVHPTDHAAPATALPNAMRGAARR